MQTSLFKVYAYVVLAMILWGMSFVWSTVVFEYYPPVTTVFLRLVISSLALWAYVLLFNNPEPIHRKDFGLFALSALFNPFLYFLGENFGLQMTSPTISAVIIATIPLLTPILGVYLLKEKLHWMNITGMLVSFTGIVVMLVRPDLSLEAPAIGVLLLFMAVLTAVGYSALLRKLSDKYSAITIITTQNTIGVFYFLPLFLFFDVRRFLTVVPDLRLVYALTSLALFASTFAYILYTLATRRLGISRTNFFSNLIPVFTFFFSWYLLGEKGTVKTITGIILVTGGVMLSQIRSNHGIKAIYRFLFLSNRK